MAIIHDIMSGTMKAYPALVAAILLSACSAPQVRQTETYDRIGQELAQAAASKPKAAFENERAKSALLPPLAPEMPAADKPVEPRFDLAVNNAPAGQVFMAIVSGTRYSMLVHPEVSGSVTVNLKDVTVRETLDVLRELYGYEYRQDGTRITILPVALQTRVFQVNYLAGQRRGQSDVRVSSGSISAGGAAAGSTGTQTQQPAPTGTGGTTPAGSALSSRVSTSSDSDFWSELASALKTLVGAEGGRQVVVNPHSGVVIVRAFPHELRNVEKFLKATQLSVERQVMLEAKIIEVQLKEGFESGINWAYFGKDGQHRSSVGADLGSFSLQNGTLSSGTTLGGALGTALAGAVSRTAGGFFGLALQTTSFAALLQFLENQGTVQVLSSPRIATLNNQKAVLKVGTDEFFITNISSSTQSTGTTTTTSPTISVQPFFSGIALDVTPQIDENANIILHIHPSVSAVAEKSKAVNLGTLGNFTLPLASSNINETDSIVRVQDGNIVAIGGLMKQEQSDDRTNMPGMSNVPLFGKKGRSFLKSEVVILLKPTIIQTERDWQQDLLEVQGRVQALDPRTLSPAQQQR